MKRPRTPAKKYHFMLGTTSRVPGAPGWHYLIIDIDTAYSCKMCLYVEATQRHTCPLHSLPRLISQPTHHGAHYFTPIKMRLKPMLTRAVKLGADHTWARLALKRGWAFLADKGEVKIPWPVERMVIGWKSQKKS